MILQMLAVHGAIGKNLTELRPMVQWGEMMPRERTTKVDEMVQRRSAKLVSQRRALEYLSMGEDIDDELDQIQEEVEAEQEFQMKQTEAQSEMRMREMAAKGKEEAANKPPPAKEQTGSTRSE
jgi:hypothetical protein